jgi:hypothetical protein
MGWAELWNGFNTRAQTLIANNTQTVDPIANPIEQTILWQLQGHALVGDHRFAAHDLHLPELYSGRPWQVTENWIAFVTINPSIGHEEDFPTRSDYQTLGAGPLIPFFENRFEIGPLPQPHLHGRNAGATPKTWIRPAIHGQAPTSRPQQTWSRIDSRLMTLFNLPPQQRRAELPLGRRAAIIDLVPWKFQDWGGDNADLTPELRDALCDAGAPHLTATLQDHVPRVIIAAGAHVWKTMERLKRKKVEPWVSATINPYQPSRIQVGKVTINRVAVPMFGVSAPTAFPPKKGMPVPFYAQLEELTPQLTAILGIQ